MSADFALDLGTATTRLLDAKHHMRFEEPTVAAVDEVSGRVLAIGFDALEMFNVRAGQIRIVRPIRSGQLVDLDVADAFLSELFRRAGIRRLTSARVLVCIHVGSSQVQRRAMVRSLKHAGARTTRFIEHPVAVARASDLAIEEPAGSMTMDVGAGTTDLAVLALGGAVTATSIPSGGDGFADAVRDELVRTRRLVVSNEVLSQLVAELGSLEPTEENTRAELIGRDVHTGQPNTAIVSGSEFREVLFERARPLIECAARSIAETPPDLANDLLAAGLVLAGEAAQLKGFARLLANATGIDVHQSSLGGKASVLGAIRCLETLNLEADDD